MPPPYYSRWPVLGDNFDILTTTQDRNGTEYISTAEHKRYPFYGTQVRGPLPGRARLAQRKQAAGPSLACRQR